MNRKLEIPIGSKFGRLEILRFVGSNKHGHRKYECLCDCGNIVEKTVSDILSNRVKSCGCLNIEKLSKRSFKHGLTKSRLYHSWSSMIQRTNYKKHICYKYYGERGIRVCNEWKDFYNFKEWAFKNGYKDGLTIERKNVNGDYCPENCKWIPKNEQAKNTRRTKIFLLNGKKMCLMELLKTIGISYYKYNKKTKNGYVKTKDIFEGIDSKKFNIERLK